MNDTGADALNEVMIVLVGLMGAGKTTVGRRLATALHCPFYDVDEELEKAAGRSVADIFEDFGETAFREGESKVLARLLSGKAGVMATGGGAFMNPQNRQRIKDKAISVWLHADIDVLMERVSRRDTRPLLRRDNPRAIMTKLIEQRYPVYAQADITIETGHSPHQQAVEDIISALAAWNKDKNNG